MEKFVGVIPLILQSHMLLLHQIVVQWKLWLQDSHKRWLVTPEWITESKKAGKWVDEEDFGTRLQAPLFESKKVFISDDFRTENTQHNNYNPQNFKTLIERLGKGKITNSAFGADILLIPAFTKHNYSQLAGQCLTWKQFFNFIQPLNTSASQSQES